jgi:hypothetical protein
MTRHRLHTGGVPSSILGVPTTYTIEINGKTYPLRNGIVCGYPPKWTERDGNSGGKVGEDVRGPFHPERKPYEYG